jgi:pimeloyl-ACP methyl ester carboxylesterase
MQVVVDGILTNYEEVGLKNNPVMVILPGWLCRSSDWLNFARKFSENYRVVILDFPGFGVTAKPEKEWDTFDYARFVENFLNKLEIKKCILLAHSFGGRVATILTAKTSLIDKLILVDGAGYEKKDWNMQVNVFIWRKLKKIVRIFTNRDFTGKIKNKVGSVDYKNAKEMRGVFVKVVNQDLSELMLKINLPTLIVWGEYDDVLTIKRAKIMKKIIPKSILRIVWSARHFPHLEKPEEFIRIIQEFLF